MRFAILAILLALSAFFSGSETAFFSLSKFDVQRMALKRERWAEKVATLLSRPGRLLITILSGNMIVNVTATTLMTGILIQLVGEGAVPIVVAIMTVLILIFGEITPKVVAVENNELWARTSSSLLMAVEILLSPLVLVLTLIQSAVLGKEKNDDLRLDEVDIESTIELAHRQGALEGEYKELLLHFLSLDHVEISEIMTPRSQVAICTYNCTKTEILNSMREYNASVCILTGKGGERPRLVDKNRLFSYKGNEKPWMGLPDAYLVNDSKSIVEFFYDVRSNRLGSFVVLDEYGDFCGIIDFERVLLEIYSKPILGEKSINEVYKRLGECYLVNGETALQDINKIFRIELKSPHYKTIGGLVTEKCGEIPSSGTKVEFGGLEIRIIKSSPKKIDLLGIKKI